MLAIFTTLTVALRELDNKEMTVSAMYDLDLMHRYLTLLRKTDQQICGSPLPSVVAVDDGLEKLIAQKPNSFFAVRQIKDKKVLYADGPGWKTVEDRTGGAVLGRLLKVGKVDVRDVKSLKDLAAHLLARDTPIRQLTLDFGTDLRGCWAGLLDLEGQPVCDAGSIEDLAQDISQVQAEKDETGKSGSSVVTNMRRFIIKNFKDDEDPDIVREVMPAFHQKILEGSKEKGGCYRTAIAPICAVLDLPDIYKRVHWSVMRKVEIPAGNRTVMYVPGDKQRDPVDFQDLKGPKFAGKLSGLRDGKTYFGDEFVWHRKDAGFTSMFPTGLPLRPCGSREAARTLQLDSEMLRDMEMTDYSLFMIPYEMPTQPECHCDHDSPRWPLVLDADPGQRALRFAVGIIDYLERDVNTWDKWLGFSMSTMKPPVEYQQFWMRMWPMYFHLPRCRVTLEGKVSLANDNTVVEMLQLGQPIIALQKLKWRGASSSRRVKYVVSGKARTCYFVQMPETSSADPATGSKYKVYPGERGTVVGFAACRPEHAGKLVVSWERYNDTDKVFEVSPEAIMGWT